MLSPTHSVLEERCKLDFWKLKVKFCIVLSSPSGAGKTSISKKLLQKIKKYCYLYHALQDQREKEK